MRKKFRKFLLICMGLSFCFLATIIYLRLNPQLMKHKELRDITFHADVTAHQVKTYFADDAEDLKIANSLIHLGFFSPIYSEAGFVMLKDQADMGYAPAQLRHADIILKRSQDDHSIKEAAKYYTLAANQGHRGAQQALLQLPQR